MNLSPLRIALVVLAGGCAPEVDLCAVAAPTRELRPLAEHRFVAHAFGSPQGLTPDEIYTESREAFEASYHNGFRVYEIDLVTLADGAVAAVHDEHESEYGLDRPFTELTRADVEGHRWKDKYPVLFGEDVVGLMVEHPDIWMILDTKWSHAEIALAMLQLAPDDGVRDRLVPHVVSAEHADLLEAMYPFPERMLARYQWDGTDAEVEANMRSHGLDDVMMWWDSRWNESIQAAMDAAGFHVWVHTPAERARIREFADRGVGVYSDGYIPCRGGP